MLGLMRVGGCVGGHSNFGFAMITDINQLDFSKRYSYADYLTWKFQERVELFKGWLARMGAPSTAHQRISGRLSFQLAQYFQQSTCELFVAPFDVRLPDSQKGTADEVVYNVVQPDLCVICDPAKIDARGCIGAPDWVIEILSPGNNKHEIQNKFRLYEEAGVKEYWIVFPAEQVVHVFDLKEDGCYQLRMMYSNEDAVPSGLFPELAVDMREVF